MSTSIKAPESVPPQPPVKKGMQTSTKWIIGILGFLALLALVAVLGLISLFPVTVVTDGDSEPVVVVEAPIADGDWFGWVTVGSDETGEITLGVDLAEMLTGQAAHDAAVEAGVITEDEDLPNDYFIANEELVSELMHLSDDAEILVVSAVDVSTHIEVTGDQLAALYDGSYVGDDVYGIAAGQPIAMDVTIENGEVASISAIYLP